MSFANSCRLAATALLILVTSLALATPPTINGCPVLPANNYWNTQIDRLPVHASSSNWVGSMGTATHIHPDWGNSNNDSGDGFGTPEVVAYGIPFITVNGNTQPLVTVTEDPVNGAPDESDFGQAPIPPNAPIEGGPNADPNSDRHVLVVDTTNCLLYEMDASFPAGGNNWTAFSAAKFDFNSNALRPASFTSADAAGLPIFPGLLRWEEVQAGEVAHAIRVTATPIWGKNGANHVWLWPARHWSGNGTNPANPPMGARFRLKSTFDISGFSAETQVILRAFKKYGLVLADGGSNWYFQGVSSLSWPDQVLTELKSITGGNFEAVDTSSLMIDVDSGQALQPVPDPPIMSYVVEGNSQAWVAFQPPAYTGNSPITSYTATCTPGPFSQSGSASPILVTGLTNGTTYLCSVTATNADGTSAPSSQASVVPTATPTLSAIAVQSRRTHGAAGVFDIAIDQGQAINGTITVEPRAPNPDHTIVFQFNDTVTSGNPYCVDSSSNVIGSATVTFAGTQATVTLSGIPDNQRVTLSITNVNGGLLSPAASIGFLVGDVNNSRSVSAADILAVKFTSGNPTNAANFRNDLNVNGSIAASDILAAKFRSGTVLSP